MAEETPGPGYTHGADGKFIKTTDSAERDAEAARLRGLGWSYRRIAREMGYANASGPQKAVQRALAAIQQEAAEEVRALELARLDGLWEKAAEIFGKDSLLVQQGRVVRVPVDIDGTASPVVDEELKLKALDRLLRIQERRARLLGLDAPSRLSVEAEQLGAEILELLGAMPPKDSGDDEH